jgi:hypothetical protein
MVLKLSHLQPFNEIHFSLTQSLAILDQLIEHVYTHSNYIYLIKALARHVLHYIHSIRALCL